MASVKTHGLEGLVATRLDSPYEPGLRSGAWQKMRVNRGQEVVIGVYTIGVSPFDALIFAYYAGDRLGYAARTRNGLTPAKTCTIVQAPEGARDQVLPVREPAGAEGRAVGRRPDGEKMVACRWLRPELVGQFEFLEWTGDHHLRHTTFIALREDKDPRSVTRE